MSLNYVHKRQAMQVESTPHRRCRRGCVWRVLGSRQESAHRRPWKQTMGNLKEIWKENDVTTPNFSKITLKASCIGDRRGVRLDSG